MPIYNLEVVPDQGLARENVRKLARLRGLSLKEVAELAGLSASSVYNWSKQNDPHDLSQKAIAAIATVFGLTYEQVFYYNEPHEKTGSPDEEARARALRQIDDLLAGIDDPGEQARAANIIIATLRATRDEFERRRAAPASPRKPGNGPTPGPTARHPGASG